MQSTIVLGGCATRVSYVAAGRGHVQSTSSSNTVIIRCPPTADACVSMASVVRNTSEQPERTTTLRSAQKLTIKLTRNWEENNEIAAELGAISSELCAWSDEYFKLQLPIGPTCVFSARCPAQSGSFIDNKVPFPFINSKSGSIPNKVYGFSILKKIRRVIEFFQIFRFYSNFVGFLFF